MEATASSQPEQANLFQIILISVIATIGGFLFGFDSGVINGTIDGLSAAFAESDWVKATDINSVISISVASMLLGCAAGAMIAGRTADILGRRGVLVFAALFFFVSAWGSGVATGPVEFIVYRILGGLAVGAASVLAPAYISEITPAHMRGRLSSIQQVAIIVGLTAAFMSNYVLAGTAGSSTSEFWLGFEAWRWMFWIEMVPAAIFFFALFFIPESPRFLVIKDKDAEAQSVLGRLFGASASENKLAEIKSSIATDHKPRLTDLLDNGKVRPIVWVGIGLAVFQQLVGINVVFYYGAVLWQSVGFTEDNALLINVIMGVVSIGAVCIALSVIDKIGRKPLLMIGSIGMAITLGTMMICFFNATTNEAGDLVLPGFWGPLALFSGVAYAAMFNLSWGPVMWVMLGEMFPNQIRGSGLGVSGFFQWFANFGVTLTFPFLLVTISLGGAYAIYFLGAVVSIFFVSRFVGETKGIELEDMKGFD
ncbi:MAG: sugar porter family MFS transporter [Pseudomonadota bacterium]